MSSQKRSFMLLFYFQILSSITQSTRCGCWLALIPLYPPFSKGEVIQNEGLTHVEIRRFVVEV